MFYWHTFHNYYLLLLLFNASASGTTSAKHFIPDAVIEEAIRLFTGQMIIVMCSINPLLRIRHYLLLIDLSKPSYLHL
jgi:hypothetical protein